MNLCLKKKQGWFNMCKVLKINSPTFSGHFNLFTSSLLFSKSQNLCDFKDQTCSSCCKLNVKKNGCKRSLVNNHSREEWYLQPFTFDPYFKFN